MRKNNRAIRAAIRNARTGAPTGIRTAIRTADFLDVEKLKQYVDALLYGTR